MAVPGLRADDSIIALGQMDAEWNQEFRWRDIERVCFKDEGLYSSDSIRIELRGRRRDYIERWDAILAMPVREIAAMIVSDCDGWGTALRQNSPWRVALR